MRRYRWLAACVLTTAINTSQAQEERFIDATSEQGRGTIFSWTADPEVTGGPDLNEPIVTDRPDFTEASVTVGRGVGQLEMGYTYSHDVQGGDTTATHSYPETLFRWGMFADWFETRVAYNYGHETVNGTTTSGSDDLYLGAKFDLTPQAGILPEMALMPQMRVPTGADAFSSDQVLPGVNWLYGWDINDFIGTGGSTQFNRAWEADTGEAYTEWAQSWTINYSLADKLGAYTEYFGLFPHSAVLAQPQNYLDGGFTYLFTDNIQYDIRAGVGLNAAADDYFVGTGLSIRFK